MNTDNIQNRSVALRSHVLGFPRIGKQRELKKKCEAFWAGKVTKKESGGRKSFAQRKLGKTESGRH